MRSPLSLLSLSLHRKLTPTILMAVEARHLHLFRSQLIPDRELLNPINHEAAVGGGACTLQPMYFLSNPSAAALPENQSFYQPAVCDPVQAKTSVNTDSGLTYNIPAPRKRSRDCFNQLYVAQNFPAPTKNSTVSQLPAGYAGEDMLLPNQQYQSEIDAIISQHTKKIRLALEEKQKRQARLLAAAIGEGAMKKLKEKDEQIQRMGKLNLVLQEKVKNLYVENQLWRDLAQTNEAKANSLRSNLERVLLHVGGEEPRAAAAAAAEEEDVESCCGSSGRGEEAEDKDEEGSSWQKCKICGEREACVLLLPCRHLCICSGCGSGAHHLQTCPICNSTMNATLHVNMSAS